MADTKNVLIIGGHGRVAQLATTKLVADGHAVTSLIRNPDQTGDIEGLGATPLIRDLTQLSAPEWAETVRPFDVVVWSAGNGGKAGAEATWAIDRDGALALIEGMESLADSPRLVMVSYMGSTTATADEDENGSWYAYVESKKAVDLRIHDGSLDAVILGPGMLTDEPASGIRRHEPGSEAPEDADTSRELVAQVIAEAVRRDTSGVTTVEFTDGEDTVAAL